MAYAFMFVVLLWMTLWSFGAAGVVASSMGDGGRWWLLVVSWQVFFFILSVLVRTGFGIKSVDFPCLIRLLLQFMFAGLLCELVLDRCSTM